MSNEIYETNYLDFYDPDKCIGDLGEKWCYFNWRIYKLQLNPQDSLQSPVFTTRLLPNTHWYLEVNLSSPGDLRSIKVSLHRLPNYENLVSKVDVIYKVILQDQIKISDKNTFEYNNNTPREEIFCFGAPFFKSETDYVKVECKLRPNKVMIPEVRHGKFDKTLPVHLRKLLQSGEFCDAFIQVGNQEFMVHSVILRARLPNLLTDTFQIIENGKRIIKIDDLPVSVVKEMLKYAYTGQAYIDLECAIDYEIRFHKYDDKFSQRCFWRDNPFATTFLHYEADSISWNLKDVSIHTNLGRERIELLGLYPSEVDIFLDVLESEEEKKGLTLTFKFCSECMPKSTIVSCKYSLVNEQTNEIFKLGETETLLHSNITEGKVKLCSLLEVMEGKRTLFARDDFLRLRTDFKFCYGSSKSSIENLYESHFDISQCTSCAALSADMECLTRIYDFTDITVVTEDGQRILSHKAILFARWAEAEKRKLKENGYIVIEGYDYEGLSKFLGRLYSGKNLCR